MRIVEFPNVKVRMKKKIESFEDNPFYQGSLGVPMDKLTESLAYSLLAGVQNTGKMVGGTYHLYAHGAKTFTEEIEVKQTPNSKFLSKLITEFAEKGWVHAVVLDKSDPNKVEEVLETRVDMLDVLTGKIGNYNWRILSRTVFVPSPKYTKDYWGFNYELGSLKKAVDFNP